MNNNEYPLTPPNTPKLTITLPPRRINPQKSKPAASGPLETTQQVQLPTGPVSHTSVFALAPVPAAPIPPFQNSISERNDTSMIRHPDFSLISFTGLRFTLMEAHPHLRRITPDTIELKDPINQIQYILHIGQLNLYINADAALRRGIVAGDLIPVGYLMFAHIFNMASDYQ